MNPISHNQYQTDFDNLKEKSLAKALMWFYQQQVADGFVDPDKLSINELYSQYSETYGIDFHVLINRVRDAYAQQVVKKPVKTEWVCPLCIENIDKIGQHKKQYIDLDINDNEYVLSLTPFPSFVNHFVLCAKQHRPMCIDQSVVADLLTLQSQLGKDFCIVSNSDHQQTGASILAHHHYQIIANASFPVMHAKALNKLPSDQADVSIERLHFPATVIKLSSNDLSHLIDQAQQFLAQWQAKSDANRCNILVCQNNATFEIYFILRQTQLATDPEFYRYKTEGIGIIEMCGYGIFPTPKVDVDVVLKEIADHPAKLMTQLLTYHAPNI